MDRACLSEYWNVLTKQIAININKDHITRYELYLGYTSEGHWVGYTFEGHWDWSEFVSVHDMRTFITNSPK